MSNLAEILKILDVIIQLEKKIETAIVSEKDTNRREKIAKAIKDRDSDALRKLLFG
jgi:hypothetical protein